MTLTPDQAQQIVDLAGWQQAGNMGGCYVDANGDGTLIHGVVTERGFFDLLRVCYNRCIVFRLGMASLSVHTQRSVDKVITNYNDIPMALALAMLEALKVT